MEADAGKLFIGGISWDTNEDRLREYFDKYGEVVEAVIMRDRATGRARGFGFIVFADPAVAERVIMEKHMIDGRMVEAKKAVPRDDQHALSKSGGSAHGSPGPSRTKKIFVGGLASTVTEADFRKYFEQFGTITDVVVMYDHNTQRPRGFGFITYDSEDAVDKALFKTFHELNVGGYGMRMDARFGLLSGGRSSYPSFGGGYGVGMNFDPGMNPAIGGSSSFNNSLQYGRQLNPYYSGNSGRYNSNVSYGGVNDSTGSVFNSLARNLWGNSGLSYSSNSASSNSFMSSANGGLGGIGNNNVNWGNPPVPAQGANAGSGYGSGNFGYGSSETNFGLGTNAYGRNAGSGVVNTFNQSTNGYGRNFGDSSGGGGGGSIYGDTTWRSGSSELDGTSPFGYGLGNAASDVTAKNSAGYMGH
uniref:RRM domain-containing protein n=1 Tax=Oryza glumipatula TaxID=40148 RepID=A0A0E0BLI1_9ORYZ